MKNLFSLILDFANAIMWAVLMGIRLHQGDGWGALTVICAVCALFNLIAGIVSFVRFKKSRTAEKQEEKVSKK